MKRAWIVAGVFTTLAVAAMLWLLGTRKPAPPIPWDQEHGGARREVQCLDCHDVGGPFPPPKNHPISQRCYQCHVRAEVP